MVENSQEDPFRADAALVWRQMRSSGPLTAVELAQKCFPVASEGPQTSIDALRRRSYARVIDSIVWMRHQKVAVWASPGSPTVFSLSQPPKEAFRAAVVLVDDDPWHEGQQPQ